MLQDRPPIPDVLLTCKDAPVTPGANVTDEDVAFYLVDLFDAGQDCRRKLGVIKACYGAEKPAPECGKD